MRASLVMSGVAQGLRRNASMTVALVLNTAVALSLVGVSILAHQEISKFRTDYAGRINVSVYLCTTPPKALPVTNPNCPKKVNPAETKAIEKALQADPTVKEVRYVDEKQAAAFAKKTLPKEQVELLGKDFEWPTSFIVKLHNTREDYQAFAAKYATFKGVDSVPNQWELLEPMLKILDGFRLGSVVLAMVVLVAMVLLTVNTIQVAAAQRRNETTIMRLVGASRWMTELPFMIEAMLATVVAALAAFVALLVSKWFVMDRLFGDMVKNKIIPDLDFGDVMLAAGISTATGVGLAIVTAFITLRLYVRL